MQYIGGQQHLRNMPGLHSIEILHNLKLEKRHSIEILENMKLEKRNKNDRVKSIPIEGAKILGCLEF